MSFSHLRIALVALLGAASVQSQEVSTGRILGRVIDADTKRGVADAGVQIVGTTLGTMTRADGSFSISRISAGTVTIHVRRLGYQARTVTGLQLAADSTLEQTIELSQSVVQVATQVVRAAANRGTVEAALDEQRNATGVVNAVTAEQIGRSPDANAAQAVQRVSGVTVQDGKYVYVRGLGERYTTTSLNGSRMPSPEPERKVVPLDLFPSGLIQTVTTSKTFTPDLPGDFGGAHVDIRTREFPGERQYTFGGSIGYTSGSWDKHVAFAPGVGGEAFALAGSGRSLPAVARQAGSLQGLSQQGVNQIIGSFRDVWRPGQRTARPNMSLRSSVGGSERLFGKRLGYLLSGTYSYSQEIKENHVRALARPSGAPEGGLTEFNRFEGTTSGESVLWGGLMNLSTLFSPNSRLGFNAVYNRTADNDARLETTDLYEDSFGPVELQRLDYVERSMWSTQLMGEHDMARHGLDWSLSGSGITRSQPDRSEVAYDLVSTTIVPGGRLWRPTGEGAVRTFADLDENAIEGRLTYRRDFGSADRPFTVKVGGLGRGTFRDSRNSSYEIWAPAIEDTVRALPPEVLFGTRFTAPDSSLFALRYLSQGGSYSAEDGIYAGFSMIEAPLTQTLRFIAGARFEHSDTRIKSLSTLGDRTFTKKTFTDVLPSATLNYRPTVDHAVRFSVSRTLARPEYRELVPFSTQDGLARKSQQGDTTLVRSLIDNVDLRWEWYPAAGELLSIGAFAKRFQDPIERVIVPTSTNPIVQARNAESATNYGVELEARKGLGAFAELLAPLTVFGSATFIRSEIDLGSAATSANADRAMVGQAPYVLNGGLTYSTREGRGSATILFHRVGTRLFEAGETAEMNVEEVARDVLDFSARWPAMRGVQLRFDAKNLLDADYVLRQSNVISERYSVGRTLQIGVNLQR